MGHYKIKGPSDKKWPRKDFKKAPSLQRKLFITSDKNISFGTLEINELGFTKAGSASPVPTRVSGAYQICLYE